MAALSAASALLQVSTLSAALVPGQLQAVEAAQSEAESESALASTMIRVALQSWDRHMVSCRGWEHCLLFDEPVVWR
eukprot:6458291-Amphidinium_carterae.3